MSSPGKGGHRVCLCATSLWPRPVLTLVPPASPVRRAGGCGWPCWGVVGTAEDGAGTGGVLSPAGDAEAVGLGVTALLSACSHQGGRECWALREARSWKCWELLPAGAHGWQERGASSPCWPGSGIWQLWALLSPFCCGVKQPHGPPQGPAVRTGGTHLHTSWVGGVKCLCLRRSWPF